MTAGARSCARRSTSHRPWPDEISTKWTTQRESGATSHGRHHPFLNPWIPRKREGGGTAIRYGNGIMADRFTVDRSRWQHGRTTSGRSNARILELLKAVAIALV